MPDGKPHLTGVWQGGSTTRGTWEGANKGTTCMGDSVGRWDGDTLVIDITGFNDKTWLVGTGTFHTEMLHGPSATSAWTKTGSTTT
jgi:hypothetical protein